MGLIGSVESDGRLTDLIYVWTHPRSSPSADHARQAVAHGQHPGGGQLGGGAGIGAWFVLLDLYGSGGSSRHRAWLKLTHVHAHVCKQVKRKESNLKMDQLHDVGATDILLFPISNSRM